MVRICDDSDKDIIKLVQKKDTCDPPAANLIGLIGETPCRKYTWLFDVLDDINRFPRKRGTA